MQTVTNPLAVNFGRLGSSAENFPGSTVEIYVSIKNQGERSAVVDLYIDVTDESSQPLLQWIVPRRVRLALAAQENETILFQVLIPESAWPHDYQYDLVIDSPDHYPEHTPLNYPQVLKVLSPQSVSKQREDPVFTLTPVTTSTQPKSLKSGETFEVEILIDNRTPLVDRFHIACTELESEYFSIHYPEVRDQYGLVIESDGLELNPGNKGVAKLKIHPPATAVAGNYFPTLKIESSNNPDLNLLDVVYIYIPPLYDLDVELVTIIDRIKNPKIESGEYELYIENQGNIERQLFITAKRFGWGGLSLTLEPTQAKLLPGSQTTLNLMAKPKGGWWNRPFYGVGKNFRFGFVFDDVRELPVPSELPEGSLIWEPYPKKWFILFAVILGILGVAGLTALAFLIWQTFFQQPPNPEIDEFASLQPVYQESKGDIIRLNWKIRYPRELGKIVITQQSSAGNSDTRTYSFKNGIPTELNFLSPSQSDNYCDFQKTQKDRILICRGIKTQAQQAGSYQFELQVFNRKNSLKPVASLRTDSIKIQAAGRPKVSEVASARDSYIESASKTDPIRLNWDIANPAQISELRLTGYRPNGTISSALQLFEFKDGKLPKELAPFCKIETILACRNVPTHGTKAGLYKFKLSAVPKKGQEDPTLIKETETIEVKPLASTKPLQKTSKVKLVPGRPTQPASPSPNPAGQVGPNGLPASIFIPPVPSPTQRPSSRPPATITRPSPTPKPTVSIRRQAAIQDADDLVRGLTIARQEQQISPSSTIWKRSQDTIFFLRQGMNREEASWRSQVPLSTINQLIAKGQQQTSNPPGNSSGTTQGSFPQTTVAPEPQWKSSQPTSQSSAMQQNDGSKQEPLW
jgi:hypothetical protein